MKQIPSIKAMMTPFPHAIESNERMDKAVAMMADYGIGHLPVTEQGKLVGLLVAEDVTKGSSRKGGKKLVRQASIREAYTVELTEPLDVVLLRMAKRKVDCALVVKDERLAGIFTRSDACRCFGYLLRSLFPRGHDDDAA
jgi:acetoin utilization protein AcuB